MANLIVGDLEVQFRSDHPRCYGGANNKQPKTALHGMDGAVEYVEPASHVRTRMRTKKESSMHPK